LGYEILYCSRCRAQLRGREFEKGDAFRIDDQAVCKACAPELVKSLPPDKVQILLKQMVLAQGKTPPKTARHEPPPNVRDAPPSKSGPAMPSLTPLWIGLAAVLLLVLGLAAWVIGGVGQAPPSPPPAPPAAVNPAPKAKEPAPAPIPPPPAKEPKVLKEPEPPRVTPSPGLLGYWALDEGAGTSVADSSGHGSSGTLLNGPAWVPGKFGTALSFDGEKSVLNVTSNGSMHDLMKTGLTVCAWVYPRGVKRGHLVDKSNANMGWVLSFKQDARIGFAGDQYSSKEVSRVSAKPLTLNVWHHVAASWDGDRAASHIHLLINGVPSGGDGIDGVGTVREGSSPTLSIGNRRTLDRGFDGLIDDVRVYNRVLSAVEILALAQGLSK
jgi:hypothetical protein